MLFIFLRLPLRQQLAALALIAFASIPGIAYTAALIELARQAAVIWPCPFGCPPHSAGGG